jgi:hypothetical protein
MPAWDGESVEHYLWRLAKHLGKEVGAEPERLAKLHVKRRHVSMQPAVRDPGQEG